MCKLLRLRGGANIVLVVNSQCYAFSIEVRRREIWAHPTVELLGTETAPALRPTRG